MIGAGGPLRFFCVLCGEPRSRIGWKIMFTNGRRRWVCAKHEKPRQR